MAESAGISRPSGRGTARTHMALLAALVAIGPFATNAYLPALPAARAAFDATLAQAQATVSLPMLVFALALVVCGPASDRFGRKAVLLAGVACFVVGSAVAMAATSLRLLAAGRAIQLIGGAAGLIVTRAIISDRYSGARATRAITALGVVALVGHAIAPPLGGYVVVHAGWRPIFAGMCALGVLLGILVWAILPETAAPAVQPAQRQSRAGGALTALVSTKFVTGALEVAFLYGSFAAFAALAPHIMLHAYGGDSAEYGRYYTVVPVGFIVGGLLMLKLRHAVSERTVAIGFCIVTVAPIVALALAQFGLRHPWAFFLPIACVCFGHSLVLPNVSVRTVSQVPERAGTAWGVLTFTQHFTAALAVQVTSGLPTRSPVPLLAILTAVGACIGALHWLCRGRVAAPAPSSNCDSP
jgi:Arabinose efflux permease